MKDQEEKGSRTFQAEARKAPGEGRFQVGEAEEEVEMSRTRALGAALRVLKARGGPGARVRTIQEAAPRTQGKERRDTVRAVHTITNDFKAAAAGSIKRRPKIRAGSQHIVVQPSLHTRGVREARRGRNATCAAS